MIRTQKLYDQNAHDQPTQASPWAAEHGNPSAAKMAEPESGEPEWSQTRAAVRGLGFRVAR